MDARGRRAASTHRVGDAAGYGAKSQQQLARTRAWLDRRKMQPGSEKLASNALLAAVLTVETLTHIDARFPANTASRRSNTTSRTSRHLLLTRACRSTSQRFAAKAVYLQPLVDRADAPDFRAVSMRDEADSARTAWRHEASKERIPSSRDRAARWCSCRAPCVESRSNVPDGALQD